MNFLALFDQAKSADKTESFDACFRVGASKPAFKKMDKQSVSRTMIINTDKTGLIKGIWLS